MTDLYAYVSTYNFNEARVLSKSKLFLSQLIPKQFLRIKTDCNVLPIGGSLKYRTGRCPWTIRHLSSPKKQSARKPCSNSLHLFVGYSSEMTRLGSQFSRHFYASFQVPSKKISQTPEPKAPGAKYRSFKPKKSKACLFQQINRLLYLKHT